MGFLTGCVQRVFFADVNAATVRVLAAEGCDVVAPRKQRCCGALSEHAGREPEALARARRLIDAFEPTGVDTIVVNVAGCGSTMKEYGRLLRDDPAYAERAAAFPAARQIRAARRYVRKRAVSSLAVPAGIGADSDAVARRSTWARTRSRSARAVRMSELFRFRAVPIPCRSVPS